MKRPFLLIGLLCLLLIAIVVAATLVAHQQPNTGSTDINRGFPTTGAPAPARQAPTHSRPTRGTQHGLTTGPLFIEPDAGFDWLYALINGAQTSIDMTMYELVDTTASADLVAACTRGVHVRVILDQSLEKSKNTSAYDQLNSAGPNCSAAWSNPQFQATHQKSLLLDGTRAVILTANLTSRYYTSTRDFALIDTDPADVAAIQTTFTTDLNSTSDLGFQPPAGDDLIWSPTSAEPDLLALINNAKKTLLVENEELGAQNIVSALAAACQRGVQVQLAMTDTSARYHANYATLQQAGCGVHIGANNSSALYIHAKTILADVGTASAVGYLGSINFSIASMTRNRELGLYLHDASLLAQLASTVNSDYTQFPTYTP